MRATKPLRAVGPLLSALGALGLAAALTAGCARTDPYQRPGLWQPEGVNDRNIAAMVQDPRDLARGHGEAGPAWRTGATAVDRWWRDKARPLPGDQAQAPPGGDSTPGQGAPGQGASGQGDATSQAGTPPPGGSSPADGGP